MGKAGSTSLQKNIFENLKNINYLTITSELIIDIIYLNSLEFKKKYLENPVTLNTSLNKQNTIVSCETLSFFGDQFIICDRLRHF